MRNRLRVAGLIAMIIGMAPSLPGASAAAAQIPVAGDRAPDYVGR